MPELQGIVLGIDGRDVADRSERMLGDCTITEQDSVVLPAEVRAVPRLDTDLDHDLTTVAVCVVGLMPLETILTRTLELLTEISTVDWPKRLRAVKPDLRRDVLRDFNESDARMCKNIGVDQVLGATAMAALWRRTFTAERDHRAGPDANAQRRGQISRQLKADLQEVINDGND